MTESEHTDTVTPSQLFQALEMTVTDGPEALVKKTAEFKALWMRATPEVRSAQNGAGQTLLHVMVVYGFEDLIKDVLQEMPKLALRHAKEKGEYPIHTAILNHEIEVVQLLLEVPGVARLKNNIGQTALHYAARFGSQDMMALCCKMRAGNINEKDRLGKTPLALAKEDNTPDVEAVLIARGADENVVGF
ncbi:MAG: ankyrin repeat domain-containing protein [Gammaproteobacteria bacterium]|nr:ankyrin repeat domain-containing protein [Gammaproteobacteria bacterium]